MTDQPENKTQLPVSGKSEEKASQNEVEMAQSVDEASALVLPDQKKQESSASKQENRKEEPPKKQEKMTRPKKKSNLKIGLLLIVLLVVCGVVGYGYYLVNQALDGLRQNIVDLNGQLESQNRTVNDSNQKRDSINQAISEELAQTKNRLNNAESRLTAQNKRLLSMSTTSREDWLLAEAEYLLKLANQRVLIERSAEGAKALLEEADGILRDLNDPDLFPLRQAIAADLAKLRLTTKVDVEGIYLALRAKTDLVESLSLHPTRQELMALDAFSEPKEVEISEELEQTALSYLDKLFASLKQFYIITDHSEKPIPMLAPDSSQYLQQNLILILERAQLALLREQQKVYSDSLNQAQIWLDKYYPKSDQVKSFINDIEHLKNINIVRELPDITPSLELLNAYIERLHLLKGDK